jgi:plasmid stabilization system protein ParE
MAEVSRHVFAMMTAPRTKQQALEAFKTKKEGYANALKHQSAKRIAEQAAAVAVEALEQAGEASLRRLADFKRHRTERVQPHPVGHRAIFDIGSIIDRAEAELQRVKALVDTAYGVRRRPSNKLQPQETVARREPSGDDDGALDPKSPQRG